MVDGSYGIEEMGRERNVSGDEIESADEGPGLLNVFGGRLGLVDLGGHGGKKDNGYSKKPRERIEIVHAEERERARERERN